MFVPVGSGGSPFLAISDNSTTATEPVMGLAKSSE